MPRRAPIVVLAAWSLGAWGGGCGSSSNEPSDPPDGGLTPADADGGLTDTDAADDVGTISLADFPASFAHAYCGRVYDCCLPGDRVEASPGTDEAGCVAVSPCGRVDGRLSTMLASFRGPLGLEEPG